MATVTTIYDDKFLCRMCFMFQYAIHNGTTNDQFSIVSKKHEKSSNACSTFLTQKNAHCPYRKCLRFILLGIQTSFVRQTIERIQNVKWTWTFVLVDIAAGIVKNIINNIFILFSSHILPYPPGKSVWLLLWANDVQ